MAAKETPADLPVSDLAAAGGHDDGSDRTNPPEPQCLEEVVRLYRPRVYRYCRARLGDHETAEDVTQEVCMALVTALGRHRRTEHSLAAFVFGIAANKVAMSHRGAYRRREDTTDAVYERPDTAPGPELCAMQADASAQMASMLACLSEQARQILTLRLAAGLTAEETARVLNMNAGAVRVAQHRALQQLRGLVDRSVLL